MCIRRSQRSSATALELAAVRSSLEAERQAAEAALTAQYEAKMAELAAQVRLTAHIRHRCTSSGTPYPSCGVCSCCCTGNHLLSVSVHAG